MTRSVVLHKIGVEEFDGFFFARKLVIGINYGIVEILEIHVYIIHLIVRFDDEFIRLETKTYKILDDDDVMQMSNLFLYLESSLYTFDWFRKSQLVLEMLL